MRKKILLRILGSCAVLSLILLIVVALQPAEFRVTRSATMAAPPSVVFAQVNDYHNWEGWSPWAKLDPNAQVSFEGATAGTGARFSWRGNDQIGVGHQTIIESRPNELIRIELEFEKPFAGTSTAEFTFQPQEDKTRVTWTMFGHNNFVGKAISLFLDCDKMVGRDFEQGLNNLKLIVEAHLREKTETVATTAADSDAPRPPLASDVASGR